MENQEEVQKIQKPYKEILLLREEAKKLHKKLTKNALPGTQFDLPKKWSDLSPEQKQKFEILATQVNAVLEKHQ